MQENKSMNIYKLIFFKKSIDKFQKTYYNSGASKIEAFVFRTRLLIGLTVDRCEDRQFTNMEF